MATRVTETVYDDIDESTEDVRTVRLSVDGQSIEIDLSEKNRDKLSKALAPYLEAGRKHASGTPSRRRSSSSAAAPVRSSGTAAVRAWAEANGVEVSSRGRISADVMSQYEAAQK